MSFSILAHSLSLWGKVIVGGAGKVNQSGHVVIDKKNGDCSSRLF